MTRMVHLAVAGDITEAEEIQEILTSAQASRPSSRAGGRAAHGLVPEASLEDAKDAIEALTEPDDSSARRNSSRLLRARVALRRAASAEPELASSCSVREGDLRGTRVLDVGCGTGRSQRWPRRACTRQGMGGRRVARDARHRARQGSRRRRPEAGRAERLPFKDGWFERAVMMLVVHLWTAPPPSPRSTACSRRKGDSSLGTLHPAHFTDYYLTPISRRSWRSITRGSGLRRNSSRATGGGLPRGRSAPARPARAALARDVLARVRGKHISTSQLVPRTSTTRPRAS